MRPNPPIQWGAVVTAGSLSHNEKMLLHALHENVLVHVSRWVVFGDRNATDPPLRIEAYASRFACAKNSRWGEYLWNDLDRMRQSHSSWDRCFQMKFVYSLIVGSERMTEADYVIYLEPDVIIRRRSLFRYIMHRSNPKVSAAFMPSYGMPHVLTHAAVRSIRAESTMRSISKTMWMSSRYHLGFVKGVGADKLFVECQSAMEWCGPMHASYNRAFLKCIGEIRGLGRCGFQRYARPEWPVPIFTAHRPMSRNQDWILPPYYTRELNATPHRLDACTVYWANEYNVTTLLLSKSHHPDMSLVNWKARIGGRRQTAHVRDACGKHWLVYHHVAPEDAHAIASALHTE